MTGSIERPLWTCPRCGRRFVTTNMSHSCYVGTREDFFDGREHLLPLFDALVDLVRTIGPFEVEVVKTRISFTTRARFAGVTRLRRDALVVQFWLKEELRSERFLRVDHLERHDWVYQVLVHDVSELDDELRGWMEAAYRVGLQEV